jgi:hypothetical protein
VEQKQDVSKSSHFISQRNDPNERDRQRLEGRRHENQLAAARIPLLLVPDLRQGNGKAQLTEFLHLIFQL